jgi:hypothetical protein
MDTSFWLEGLPLYLMRRELSISLNQNTQRQMRVRIPPRPQFSFWRFHDLHVVVFQQISRCVIHLRNGQLEIYLRLNQV